jgi:hypothetical protein
LCHKTTSEPVGPADDDPRCLAVFHFAECVSRRGALGGGKGP